MFPREVICGDLHGRCRGRSEEPSNLCVVIVTVSTLRLFTQALWEEARELVGKGREPVHPAGDAPVRQFVAHDVTEGDAVVCEKVVAAPGKSVLKLVYLGIYLCVCVSVFVCI